MRERRLDNPIIIPGVLSFLAYGTWHANVKGLNDFPQDDWPDNIELLYYSFHVMAGLGTLFILIMGVAVLLEWRGRLLDTRRVAVGADAGVSVPLHRHDGGLDDDGARATTVAHLRTDADRARVESQRRVRAPRSSR